MNFPAIEHRTMPIAAEVKIDPFPVGGPHLGRLSKICPFGEEVTLRQRAKRVK